MTARGPYAEYKDSGVEWVGAVPNHWNLGQIRRFVEIVNGGTPTPDPENWEGPVAWATPVDLNAVDGRAIGSTSRTLTEVGLASGSAAVPAGSVLLSTRAPIGYSALTTARTAFNQGCKAMVPGRDLVPLFLLFLTQAAKHELLRRGQGTTFLELSTGALASTEVPLPSSPEQLQIASFLDRETAEIDAFIADQEELIGLLAERRAATISHAVTNGLDPNVPMKDSGVEWLGEVPASWAVRAIRTISQVKRGASPRPIDDPVYFDDEGHWAWVRIQDVTASQGLLLETAQRLSELGASLSVKLSPGALFLSIAGSVGKPCISGIPCCIHDGFVYFPKLDDLLGRFLFRVFESGQPFRGLGKMGTQLNLNTDTVGGVSVAVPSGDEIQEILIALDIALVELDAAIADAREAISLSRERRAALISAAVTGKIDVREHGAVK